MQRFLFILLGLVLICPAPAIAAGTNVPVTVDLGDDPLRPTFIAALPEAVAKRPGDRPAVDGMLRLVRIDHESGEAGPPVFGTSRIKDGSLRFQPEFRLRPGSRYRVVLSLPHQKPVEIDHTTPAAVDEQPPAVTDVYPSAAELPANLLKFYVYFSRPMRQTDKIFDQMHLLNEKGEPVHDPWRRFQQWSDDGRRLTLWIHPGRVKQGVNLREEFGPVLTPGKRFTLRLDAALADLSGNPMRAAFEKPFTATAEKRERIDLTRWKLSTPKAGSQEPLRVTFAEPLDHALLGRLIRIQGPNGRVLEGHAEVGENEMSWSFAPASPWDAQGYTLIADELLEDLAGNTALRVFDTDMAAAKNPPITRLTFVPSAQK